MRATDTDWRPFAGGVALEEAAANYRRAFGRMRWPAEIDTLPPWPWWHGIAVWTRWIWRAFR